VSASFPPIYHMLAGIGQAPRSLCHNVGGLLMFIWVGNFLVTYHNVSDLHIHECLHDYMYVRMLGCMSTPLYVQVTHTQHTHTRTHIIHTCLGLTSSGWVAPYFSPGSAQVIRLIVVRSIRRVRTPSELSNHPSHMRGVWGTVRTQEM